MEHKELIKEEIEKELHYWTHEFVPGDNSGKLMQSIMIKKLTLQLNALKPVD